MLSMITGDSKLFSSSTELYYGEQINYTRARTDRKRGNGFNRKAGRLD